MNGRQKSIAPGKPNRLDNLKNVGGADPVNILEIIHVFNSNCPPGMTFHTQVTLKPPPPPVVYI